MKAALAFAAACVVVLTGCQPSFTDLERAASVARENRVKAEQALDYSKGAVADCERIAARNRSQNRSDAEWVDSIAKLQPVIKREELDLELAKQAEQRAVARMERHPLRR